MIYRDTDIELALHGAFVGPATIKQADDAIAALEHDASDAEIAIACAHSLLLRHPPAASYAVDSYRLSIDHDVSAAGCRTNKPHTGRCPLGYDWALGRVVGIVTTDKSKAFMWAVEALLRGYGVTRCAPVGVLSAFAGHGVDGSAYRNIVDQRRSIEFRNRLRTTPTDDEVPF